METSLSVPADLLKIAIEYVDEIFIDVKILAKEDAKGILNLDIDLYLENLELIDKSNIKNDKITFRIPLNNEYTLKEDNIKLILNLIQKYPNYKVEIFKTHNLAKSKYESLNKKFIQFSEISDETIDDVYEKISKINSNLTVISL